MSTMKKTHSIFVPIIAMLVTSCNLFNKAPQPSSEIITSVDTNTQSSTSTTTSSIDMDALFKIGNATSKTTNKHIKQYYYDIDPYFNGEDFLSQLRDLNKSKLVTRVGYDDMWKYYGQTDYFSKPFSGTSGQFSAYYKGTSASKGSMNKEHVWPASRTVGGRGNDPLEDDIHMVRPTLVSDNSDRGNSLFAESGAWDPASLGHPEFRGDAARIVFYCVITDSRLGLLDVANTTSANHMMGKLSDLLKWNLEYPVAQREMNRNDGVEANTPQKNRNPFIDHPSYACKIWGGTNADTKSICGMN